MDAIVLKPQTHSYFAFGHPIRSDFALPELPVYSGKADKTTITVRQAALAPVPADERNAGIFRVHNGVVEFEQEDLVRLRIPAPDLVEMEVLNGAPMDQASLFLTGSGFAAACHLGGRVPLHASAVVGDGKAIAFTGRSGAGKSTMAMACLAGGLDLVSDDVVLIDRTDNGEPALTASFPRLKLWRQSMDHFNIPARPEERLQQDQEKYHLPLPDHPLFAKVPLAAIFELVEIPLGQPVRIQRAPPFQALQILRENIFRLSLVTALHQEDHVFRTLSEFCRSVPVFRLCRPKDFCQQAALMDAIFSKLDTLKDASQ